MPRKSIPSNTLLAAVRHYFALQQQQLAAYLGRLGLESSRLTSREARTIEPLLAPTVRAGLLVPGDASCDNRQLLAALTAAGERVGVRAAAGFVHHVASAADRVTGVVLADGTVPLTAFLPTDRAFRIGQRRDVQVRKLVCVGTVEERIDALVAGKSELADLAVGDGEGWLTELGTDELRSLLTLGSEAVGG